jgi:hypothetical protein
METANNFEKLTNTFLVEDGEYFANQTDYFPGPGDEDDDEDEEDNSKGGDDDNPPLDDDVVHSPLTTETGGKPK